MSYTSPTIVPSGTTFAQLRAGGFAAQMTRLAAANHFSPAVASLISGNFDAIRAGIVHTIDAYLAGEPMTTADVNAKLLVYATAIKAIFVALEEVDVLVSNNPGTLANLASAAPTGHRKRRTFP